MYNYLLFTEWRVNSESWGHAITCSTWSAREEYVFMWPLLSSFGNCGKIFLKYSLAGTVFQTEFHEAAQQLINIHLIFKILKCLGFLVSANHSRVLLNAIFIELFLWLLTCYRIYVRTGQCKLGILENKFSPASACDGMTIDNFATIAKRSYSEKNV